MAFEVRDAFVQGAYEVRAGLTRRSDEGDDHRRDRYDARDRGDYSELPVFVHDGPRCARRATRDFGRIAGVRFPAGHNYGNRCFLRGDDATLVGSGATLIGVNYQIGSNNRLELPAGGR